MDITYQLTYDLPIQYRNIKIYSATVKDYLYFNIYSQCLLLDKNSIPDIKIISMSYLEYLYRSAETDLEKKPYLIWFDRLLSICLKDEKDFEDIEKSLHRYCYDEKKKPFFYLGGERFYPADFEEIRKIIAEQNMLELLDENVSKDVRDSLEQARLYKQKLSGTKVASLEDYIVSLSTVTGWTMEYIYAMTMRKFIKSIRRLDNFIHYKIYLAASMSGMVEFKDKSFIKHWLINLEEKESEYNDVTMDLDRMQKTVSLESAKK